ncbi:glycosyltransferase family 4 protein [Psychroflexus salis]|uniref:Glycosyl transferase family 1 domain-containing protein n=1 Tax=Psychroflexus salis TaxID=1526574 RepID=A0A916ZSA3_9FLAO|nr:glycosyltransferase family 4 protein [Psychroflexus salis]GGE10502.1 hypothetical protein GCM10010831_10020 [Psychroflexus salis]
MKTLLYLGNKLATKGNTPTSIETLGNWLENESFKVIKASSLQNQLLRLVDMWWYILRFKSEINYILIDTYSTTGFWFSYTSSVLSRIFKLKYIPILRGGNLPDRLKNNPKLCQHLFGKAYLNIAPSHYLLEAFQKAGFKNLKFIPNTIEIEKYPFQLRKKAEPNLLYVRSFAHIYNPLLALKVLKEIVQTYPKANLSMIGPFKDDSIDQCKAFAKANNLPVTFTGGMPKEDWLAYAKDFDIFINTTNVDNTPVSVIEAMALGLPVVTTNVGGIPYLLKEDEALLVPPNNVMAMTNAITELLESPAKVEELSIKGRKKVEAFDWQTVKHQWLEILQ